MVDLNALRVFEKVASLRSFSAAAKALGLPKSSVSRNVARLEKELGARLLQRTTRKVVLTPVGQALQVRCEDLLGRVCETLDYVGSLGGKPSGLLKVSAGIGFGINVLSEQLPEFLARYPKLGVALDLTSKLGDPLDGSSDVAIRLGPLPDSGAVCVPLGRMSRYLCAAPSYLRHRGTPRRLRDIADHDTIEMPRGDGRPRHWTFTKDGAVEDIELRPRVVVNEAITIHRLVTNGVGLGVISGYLCAPDLTAGRLFRLFPDWEAPPVEVNIVFPSRRELAPAVRAFVEFMKEVTARGPLWQKSLSN
jgi:LysR family transcriptional regulator, regulator for bpeEF and oprC